jgi:hypothetical protein
MGTKRAMTEVAWLRWRMECLENQMLAERRRALTPAARRHRTRVGRRLHTCVTDLHVPHRHRVTNR